MASADVLSSEPASLLGPANQTLVGLTDAVGSITLEDTSGSDKTPNDPPSPRPPRPAHVYTRSQALRLCKSPLVKVPDGMPLLKDWFGDWNDQNLSNKKDSDVSASTNGTRDRRFRRDADDGETSSRFRSTLSQPSQMGNFKHQPLRGSDRDRDLTKDRDKSAETLRSLSEKFDRERLGLAASNAARGKERETAPHLGSTSGSRVTSASQLGTTSRREEPRAPARKRAGDNADDWRRGPDSGRGRDDRSERNEKDDRERPRSRARNSSRSRRESSATRRDRERDREDRDKDRDADKPRDRRRADRDREDTSRRNRDADRDGDDENRHWRDDGRRDERQARRDRERERDRDREWGADRTRDKDRWNVDDREARPKRGGRDRRSGTGVEEGRDREHRGDREREKDKDPAWLHEPAVPEHTGGGIIGGKGADGEMDMLQAWKKTLQEHDEKKRAKETAEEPTTEKLDGLQQLVLQMKQSQEDSDGGAAPNSTLPTLPRPASRETREEVARESKSAATLSAISSNNPSSPSSHVSEASNPLLAMLKSAAQDTSPSTRTTSLSTDPTSLGGSAQGASSPVIASSVPNPTLTPSTTDAARSSPQYNPPPVGSRFHALGARGSVPSGVQRTADPAIASMGSIQQVPSDGPSYPSPNLASQPPAGLGSMQQFQDASSRMGSDSRERQMLESLRAQQALSGYESPTAQLYPDRGLDLGNYGQGDYRRLGTGSPVSPYPDMGINAGQGVSPGAAGLDGLGGSAFPGGRGGSRFAKLWDNDARNRQGLPAAGRGQGSVDLGSYQGQNNLRQDMGSLGNGMNGNGPDARIPEHLLAMMNGSAQRGGPAHAPSANPGSFAVNYPNNHLLQQQLQQQQQQQQQFGGSRHDLMHDRLDDRNFVPDNLVPGLRNAPLGRTRETGGNFYGDQLEEQLGYGGQRLPPLQGRGLDMHSGTVQSLQGGSHLRGAGVPLQQGQFRGGPSPISNHGLQQLQNQQRVPVGLANLGSRPPHDPGQFIGGPQAGGLGGHPSQAGFNNIGGVGGGFGGAPQMRNQPGLQNMLNQNVLGNLGMPTGLDPRSSQAQLLGVGINGAGMRGGYGGGQQAPSGPVPGGGYMTRQQQMQMGGGMMPAHLQQTPSPVQTSQDLMALLMGRRPE